MLVRLPIRLAASRLHLHGAAVSVAAGTRAAGGGSTLLGGGKAAATVSAVGTAPMCALVTHARADVALWQSDGPLRRGAPRGARGSRHTLYGRTLKKCCCVWNRASFGPDGYGSMPSATHNYIIIE